MTNDNQRTIEVSERTYRRFEQRREATAQRDLPPMDADTFLGTLLDTAEAARNGYYADGEGEESDDEPGDWRDELKTRSGDGESEASECPECGSELRHQLGSDRPACPSCGWEA